MSGPDKVRRLAFLGLRRLSGIAGDWPRRSYPLAVCRALASAYLRPDRVSMQGLSMYLNSTDCAMSPILRRQRAWEPFETKVFLSLLSPGNRVVDVGANIGYYTLLAARAVGPRGSVLALEPEWLNYLLLRLNLGENGIRHARAVRAAAGEKRGEGHLYLSTWNKGDHRVFGGDDPRDHIGVPVVSLDEVVGGEHGRISLVKMDVQGAELKVLRGMECVLSESRGVRVITEFLALGSGGGGRLFRSLARPPARQGVPPATYRRGYVHPGLCRPPGAPPPVPVPPGRFHESTLGARVSDPPRRE